MSSFPVLDMVIGIISVYFLLNIIKSSEIELWFPILKTRARLPENWLMRIFNLTAPYSSGVPLTNADGQPVSLGEEIMNHRIVTGLSKKGRSTS